MSASDEGSILDTSACLSNMQCMNAICGATLLIKPLKSDLHPIIAGAPSVHTAETIFQERLCKGVIQNIFYIDGLFSCYNLFAKEKLFFNFLSFNVTYKCDKLV